MTSEAQPIPSIDLRPDDPPSEGSGRDRVAAGLRNGGGVQGLLGHHGQVPAVPPVSAGRPRSLSGRSATPGNRALRSQLVALDVGAVLGTWIVVAPWLQGPPGSLDRLAPAFAAAVVALLALRSLGLYRSQHCARRSDELLRIAVANLMAAAGFVVTEVQLATPSPKIFLAAAGGTILLGAVRWEFGRYLRTRRAEGRFLRGVVLVGTNQDAVDLRTMLRAEPELGYTVTAVVGDGADGPAWSDLPSGASVADIPQLATATGATGIVVVPCSLSGAIVQQALAEAAAANLHAQVWTGRWGVGSRRLRSVPVSGEPFFYVEPRPSPTWQMGVKRAVDVVGAIAGLLLAAPLLLVAAVSVKLEDGGPVLFRATRIGWHGKPFVAYKIRSMAPEGGVSPEALATLNERTDGPLFKASADPRVTKVGRLLRSSSIDELPQLWNVLRGTMSLVGPRPALPSEAVQFDAELGRRHAVRPGLTGLWQVEARRNPSFHAYRRLDLRYVDDWSLGLDLSILLATVPCVLSHAIRELRGHRRH